MGPYSVPNFAAGAYSTVLALRTIESHLGTGSQQMSYTTSLDLVVDGQEMEVDFACWYRRSRMSDQLEDAVPVFGEAKSFANEAIQEKDTARMRALAKRVPGSVLVFAVLKNSLSATEVRLLKGLALWGRVPLPDGRPRAAVVVLTALEMFADFSVGNTWKEHGGIHADLVEPASVWLDNLWTLAEFTQILYLGLPTMFEWFEERYRRRTEARRKR